MGKTYQSVVINAPVETVWSKLRDFHDLSWAPDVVTRVDVVGDKAGDQPGAKRVLNEAFHETLHALDDDNRELTYSIDEGPSPVSSNEVSSYEGHVVVRPVTEGDQQGAKRVLNEAFHETLHALDDDNRELTYSIDEGPSPVSSNEVSSYEGHVVVRPVTEGDGGTFVEWYSHWKGNDDSAAEFCHGIYAGLLEQLKKTLEH